MISKDTISLVRERTNLVEVISESVPTLKRRGRRFVGLCPFHQEKTPSFHVNPETNHFHCFGCQEGGDAIAFLQRIEGYTFLEAVRALAERAGIEIQERDERVDKEVDRKRREREVLYSCLQMAATWYEEQMRVHPRRGFAIDELARRGLTPDNEAVQAFRVGYAPPEWDGLATFLKKQGVSPVVGEESGLLVARSGGSGHYDRFRHRLMFAVMDPRGRVIAFSGRSLPPLPEEANAQREPPPKYINSPESPVYLKKSNLFGLWQARHAIRKEERAILVEGNFDVVSLHARGVGNVVAPLGTAFTEEQAVLLRRYSVAVTLLFDGDAAGRKAARAAEKPCDDAGLDAKVATLPDKVDPDELVRTKGVEALRHTLAEGRGLLEYLIDQELNETFNAADLRERVARIERVAALLARAKDPVVRGMLKAYADYAASRLDLVRSAPDAFASLERRVSTAARAAGSPQARVVRGPRPSEARVRPKTPGQEERKAMVEALLDFPVLLEDSEILPMLDLLEGESARIVASLRHSMRMNERGEKVLDSAEFLAQMLGAIHDFASARLAAPAHETIDDARATLRVNAKKLREINVARETSEIVREQHRVVGDWDAELELAKHADALVRKRLGLPATSLSMPEASTGSSTAKGVNGK
jgi:DNA primase